MKKSEIYIPVGNGIRLHVRLSIPDDPRSLVIFSSGRARSRFSTRNRLIAGILNKENIATLITDLLTEAEGGNIINRFNINLLTHRLVTITNYAKQIPEFQDLPIGFFAEDTGAASAIQAASKLGNTVHAIVSRAGRPDLANNLAEAKTPVMLIVGGLDSKAIHLNEYAGSLMYCENQLTLIEGASNSFEEPGKIHEVSLLAASWFKKYLPASGFLSPLSTHENTIRPSEYSAPLSR